MIWYSCVVWMILIVITLTSPSIVCFIYSKFNMHLPMSFIFKVAQVFFNMHYALFRFVESIYYLEVAITNKWNSCYSVRPLSIADISADIT